MATKKEAIVLCLDVGPHMRQRDGDHPTALEQAVECINWIVQRKIFTDSKDEIGLVLFGTNDTDNPLANGVEDDNVEGGYDNISVVREIQPVAWDLVKYALNEIPPRGPAVPADFVDAIAVSFDLLIKAASEKKFAAKQLVLLSNLGGKFSDDQLSKITEAIKNVGVELTVFGPHLRVDDEENDDADDASTQNGQEYLKKTEQQMLGERYMSKILKEVNGIAYSFSNALLLLSKFATRDVRPTPWKVNLELGDTIKIPVCLYVKTKQMKLKQAWKWIDAQNTSAEIRIDRTYHKRDEDENQDAAANANADENQDEAKLPSTKPKNKALSDDEEEHDYDDREKGPSTITRGLEVSVEELAKAYYYGTTIVPLNKMDTDAMKYKDSEKSLKILSFIDRKHAKRQYFLGDGARLAYADAGYDEGTAAFSAFIHAMKEENAVALVRYCYSASSKPRMGILIPVIEPNEEGGNTEYCVYISFPYNEDFRNFQFDTLKDQELSDDQLKLIDDLIISMDLTNAEVDQKGRRCEAYEPSNLPNPQLQHQCTCMAHRVLYPNQPLPRAQKRLLDSISPLPERLALTKPIFEKIQKAFPLKKEEKLDKRTAADVFQMAGAESGGPAEKVARQENAAAPTRDVSIRITSVRPVEDYIGALKEDENCFEEASQKLIAIIQQYIFDALGTELYQKAVKCIRVFREKSIEFSKPGVYNLFLKDLKPRLLDDAKKDFVRLLDADDLSLITHKECKASNIKEAEAAAFLKLEEVKPKNEPVSSQSARDSNLLDELE